MTVCFPDEEIRRDLKNEHFIETVVTWKSDATVFPGLEDDDRLGVVSDGSSDKNYNVTDSVDSLRFTNVRIMNYILYKLFTSGK